MNLRHVPSLKASKRGYQIIFVLPIIVLSSLFSTCSGCGDLPETLEFNYPEIVGTVNSPLGDIPPQWRGTPEPGTAYAIAPRFAGGTHPRSQYRYNLRDRQGYCGGQTVYDYRYFSKRRHKIGEDIPENRREH